MLQRVDQCINATAHPQNTCLHEPSPTIPCTSSTTPSQDRFVHRGYERTASSSAGEEGYPCSTKTHVSNRMTRIPAKRMASEGKVPRSDCPSALQQVHQHLHRRDKELHRKSSSAGVHSFNTYYALTDHREKHDHHMSFKNTSITDTKRLHLQS